MFNGLLHILLQVMLLIRCSRNKYRISSLTCGQLQPHFQKVCLSIVVFVIVPLAKLILGTNIYNDEI
jgi:hypothetical protein